MSVLAQTPPVWPATIPGMSGKTLGGLSLYPIANLVDRETALRLYMQANTWFSNEEGVEGQIKVGQYADLAYCPPITSACRKTKFAILFRC